MRFHHKKSQLNSEKWIDGLFISSIDSKTNLATWTGYGQTWMMIWNTFVHIYISKWFMWIIQSYDDLPLLSHFPIARSVFVFIQMATRQMIKATVAHAHTSHTCVWTQACESNKYIRVLTPNNYQQELWRKKIWQITGMVFVISFANHMQIEAIIMHLCNQITYNLCDC